MGKDYYSILGVPRDVDENALKAAYKKVRQLSLFPDFSLLISTIINFRLRSNIILIEIVTIKKLLLKSKSIHVGIFVFGLPDF